ncbi:MAG: MFS transporter [Nitrospirota bacterium]|nr:MFS transporter [Nitrospirota bacterium]
MKRAWTGILDGYLAGIRGGLLSRTLKSAPFVALLSAYTLSQFSEGMTQTALTWLAFRIHHNDVALVGRIGLLQTIIPFLILIPVGVLVDILPRSIFMAGINLFKGATYAIIPLIGLFEPVKAGPLILVVISTAILSAGFGPAFNAAIPGFVPADRLKQANGWVQIAGQGGYFLGPLATAGLLLLVPAEWLLVLSGGGFVLAGFLFALIAPPLVEKDKKGREEATPFGETKAMNGLFFSIGLLSKSWILILCALLLMLFGLFNAPMSLIFPLLSSEFYKTPPSFFALLSGSYFLGSFLGGVVLLGRKLPGHFPMILGGMILSAVGFVLLPTLPAPWTGALCLLVVGLGLSWAQPLVLSTIQHVAPRESLGRILSLVMTFFLLSALLGIEGGTLFLHHHSVKAFLHFEGAFLLPISLLLLLLVTHFRTRLS